MGRGRQMARHSLAAAHHDGNLHALAGRRRHLAGNGLQLGRWGNGWDDGAQAEAV